MPGADAEAPPAERAVGALWSFGKCLGALLPVYLAGYYGFSISLVLLGLMLYIGWKHGRIEKVMRLKSAMYLLENEREFTTQKVFRAKRDLPPWVRHARRGGSCVLLCRGCHTWKPPWIFIYQNLNQLYFLFAPNLNFHKK